MPKNSMSEQGTEVINLHREVFMFEKLCKLRSCPLPCGGNSRRDFNLLLPYQIFLHPGQNY